MSGTDLDGNAVETDAYLDAEGQGLELEQGSYTASIPASPLMPDGVALATPQDQWSITIADDVAPGDSIDATAQPIAFTQVSDLTTVTDDQIAASHDYAVKGGMDQATADGLRDALVSKRQAAADQKAAEQAAAAEAAAKAKTHYECEYFSFDVPDSWAGSWSVEKGTGRFTNNGGQFWYSIGYQVQGPDRTRWFLVALRPVSDGKQPGCDDVLIDQMGTTSTSPSYTVMICYAAEGAFSTATIPGDAESGTHRSEILAIEGSFSVK